MNIIAGLSNISELRDHENGKSDRCRPSSSKTPFLTHRRHAAARSGTRFKVGGGLHGLVFFAGFRSIRTAITATNVGG